MSAAELESLKFDVDNLCMAGKALCRLLEEQSVRLNRPVPAEVSQMRVAISYAEANK